MRSRFVHLTNGFDFSVVRNAIRVIFLFKTNATMNYDRRWHNNERNHLDSYFPFFKPLLEAFKFIYILKIIQLMKV